MPSTTYLMLRSAPLARLEARTDADAGLLVLHGTFLHTLLGFGRPFRDRVAHRARYAVGEPILAIDHQILREDLRRRIARRCTLWLLDSMIEGSNPREPGRN